MQGSWNSAILRTQNFAQNRHLIQNCLARTVCRTSKFSHITPTLRSLHWLKLRERIEYKIISLTYNALQYHQPSYLNKLGNKSKPSRKDVVTFAVFVIHLTSLLLPQLLHPWFTLNQIIVIPCTTAFQLIKLIAFS